MKKLILLSLLIFLTACTQKPKTVEVKDTCDTLNVFNWNIYIGEHVIENFEKQNNVRVNYSLTDSNEAIYTKLLSGAKYDIIVPTDYLIDRLINEGLLSKIDKTKLSNFNKLHPYSLAKDFDPNNDYSIPYFFGNSGLVYDSSKVDVQDIEQQGWDILKNPKYKNQIYMYDLERDGFMIALKSLGYSMNTQDDKQLNEAYEWLVDLHKTMEPTYVTDEVIDGMINGDKAISFMYNGDAAYVLSENPNMKFHRPKQGTFYWTDSMVIPNNSECKELAHKFIDHVLSNDSALDNSLTVGYSSPNKEVFDELVNGTFKGNEAYNVLEAREVDEVFKTNDLTREKLSELWVKVKNN